jgi:hypothetical protein
MKNFFPLVMLTSFSLLQGLPQQILLLQGEETVLDKEQKYKLSTIGYERAGALPFKILNDKNILSQYPKFLFAAKVPEKNNVYTLFLKPLSKLLEIDINENFALGQEEKLVDFILKSSDLTNQAVVIAWAPEKIDDLLKAFKVDDVKNKWAKDTFDRFYILTFDENGKASLVDLPQKLLFKDHSE